MRCLCVTLGCPGQRSYSIDALDDISTSSMMKVQWHK